jgi:hypothetical protein
VGRALRNYGFVAIFFAICLLPLAAAALRVTVVKPIDETRRLAAPPTWSWPPDLATITRQADRWYGDHFGLRSLLIRLKTQIDFSLFNTSSRIHIGRDGWLFYRSIIDRQRLNAHRFYSKEADHVVRNLARLNRALREEGITLIVTWNVLADQFVPKDVLPATFPKLPDPPGVDALLRALAHELGPAYVDMSALMRQLMRQQGRSPFYKTDFHWNALGACAAARAIVRRAAELEGLAAPHYAFDIDLVERDWHDGGIAREMPLLFPRAERELFLRHEFLDSQGFERTFADPLWVQIYRRTGDTAGLLPPIAYVGDSFQWGIQLCGFHAHFRASYLTRWSGRPKVSDFIAALPPDTRILLLQTMERSRSTRTLSDDSN